MGIARNEAAIRISIYILSSTCLSEFRLKYVFSDRKDGRTCSIF